ncbi:MAG: GPR1/FUN34/YaaH family transporter [Deferrisomatales bacterium]|nr:GPR1/FUN34/YaaH family transporter [Deferrisomatales bacterium]
MENGSAQNWANGGPLVIFAVAVLVGCLGGFRAGYVPMSSAPLMVGVLVACAIPQLVGGIIAYRRNEVLLGTISCLFGTTVTLGAALTLYIQVFMAPAPGAFTPELMGFFWITLFVITEVIAICFGRMSWFLMLGIAEVGVVFLLEGMFALQGNLALGALAGYLELGFAGFCTYAASAILLGEHFQKPVLPLGKPIFS